MVHDPFPAAVLQLRASAEEPAEFYRPFLDVTPVSGVAVSTLGGLLGNETVAASDGVAARLDELQFDLGEGPCWDAMRTGRPVLRPDLAGETDWPAFTSAVLEHPVTSVFAFPLVVGSLQLGAVDLYSSTRVALTRLQTRQAHELAVIVGRQVLRHALAGLHPEEDQIVPRGFPRRVVHQATGMVMAQLDLGAADATLVLQGHAFAEGRSVMEIAHAVIDRQLTFSSKDDGIEASE
jgi:hypothetical protein